MIGDHVPPLEPDYLEAVVAAALQEDIGPGDLTTESLLAKGAVSTAHLLAKEDMVLAGLDIFRRVILHLDPAAAFTPHLAEGDRVTAGTVVLEVRASTEALFKGERTALNFVQFLSGIATRTSLFLQRLDGLPVRLLDTRKTHPGLRPLEKYAVRLAGAGNHRFGLFDGILVKDNHRRVIPDLRASLAHLRRLFPLSRVEVECQSLAEVEEAVGAGADILLLDNLGIDDLRRAVAMSKGCCQLEASGNVGLENIRDIALTGVHFISAGTIIHGATFVDLSLEILD